MKILTNFSIYRRMKSGARWVKICLVCLGLVLVTGASYWQVGRCDFVDYDDGDYVFDNQMVKRGMTKEGLIWAFRATHASNWHPLTWISHMLDCELFGLDPGKHHLSNLILHLANTLLLFGLLMKLTGGLWPGAFVAALFALHPLHVESVAWVAERKDVLSTFFGLMAVVAFANFQRPAPEGGKRASGFYWVAVVCFALSLMSKPMLVTLPFVLLLLDYWPGRRFAQAQTDFSWRRLSDFALEKWPFFLLSTVSCVVTVQVQRGATIMPLESFGLGERLANVVVAYGAYLRKVVWPTDLAFFYPLAPVPAWQILVSGLVLFLITLGVFQMRHRWPFALVGWLWFLGMLVPVVGFVQVGEQSMADRYTYLPAVGLFIGLAWGIKSWLQSHPRFAPVITGCATVLLAACAILTARQVSYWQDSRSLLERALRVTKSNFLAHNNLGVILAKQGDFAAAEEHFRAAVRFKPRYARAHRNLAGVLVQTGRIEEALQHYYRALELAPQDPELLYNLGAALARVGRLDEAAAYCSRAVALAPLDPLARYNYGLVLTLQKKHPQAVEQLSECLRLKPEDAVTHFQMGLTLREMGNWPAAMDHLAQALRLRPDWPEALKEQAWMLATAAVSGLRNVAQAVHLAEKANRLTGSVQPTYLATLAEVYAQAGRYAEAVSAAREAVAQAQKHGLQDFADQMQSRLDSYRAARPWIEIGPDESKSSDAP
jgi:tetratricopeptide (TPR) repeat protein